MKVEPMMLKYYFVRLEVADNVGCDHDLARFAYLTPYGWIIGWVYCLAEDVINKTGKCIGATPLG